MLNADISTTEIYTYVKSERLSGLIKDTHPLNKMNFKNNKIAILLPIDSARLSKLQ